MSLQLVTCLGLDRGNAHQLVYNILYVIPYLHVAFD